MIGLCVFLIVAMVIVYMVSFISMACMYDEKNIEFSFWSFVCLFVPIINTIAWIKLNDGGGKLKKFFSLDKFINDVKK